MQARRRQHFENRQDIKKRKQQEKGQKKIRCLIGLPYHQPFLDHLSATVKSTFRPYAVLAAGSNSFDNLQMLN